MLCCIDVDGTIDAFPYQMAAIMQAYRAAGHTVHVLTGISGDTVTQQDVDNKAGYLTALGAGEAYDELVVVPSPVGDNKASYMREKGCDLLIDNDKSVAKAAADICPILIVWQSRVS